MFWLQQVRDECMFYLLRHTSIFVPISDKKHLQVVGSPVKYSRKKSSEKVNIPQSGKKRKRTFGCKYLSNGEFQGSSIQTAEEHKPFSRSAKWKHDKRRQSLNIPESRDKTFSRISDKRGLKRFRGVAKENQNTPDTDNMELELTGPYCSKTQTAVTCLKDQSYHELDEAAVRAIICRRSFGFSKLRLCPKQNGVRMLANLNTSSKMLQERTPKYRCSWMRKISKARSIIYKSNRVKSVNWRLRGIHAVLKGLLFRGPEKLGSTVFDYNDVYRKLRPFITTLKNVSTSMPGVYIVAADVSKAFDSVDQDKLLRMMEDVMVKNIYFLQQNHQIAWLKISGSDHKHKLVRDEVVWLGLAAYIEVLNRKQARYKALLTKLRSKFYGHRITGNESSELRYAVERSHSSCLWKIKF
ncbi:hypothetical protein F3Y22_tig00000340pilonHSYRG01443 [Hibiscus syriacus]|uniref:Telomerase reverse transcriptase n=1 Tax=Hibiscus syriacus TaxID=106335 RepID=A0A6A3D1T4_HIBSY|nr:hypothetical protein F3Y22_tig00000340pilonHSYRG01443 [Hibiscus syriacus]